MTWLLQPPPLLAILIVIAVAAVVVERGIGLRRLVAVLTRAGSPREDVEVWGKPDPAPPEKRPFDYDRLVELEPPTGLAPMEERIAAPPEQRPDLPAQHEGEA